MLHSEFIPAAEKNSRALMVMLHGLGDSLEGYRWFTPALGLPWLNFLLVNAPDEYYGGYSWFDLNDQRPGVLRSRQALNELLADCQQRGFPADQITLGGFSQGCLMTFDTGLHYPQRLAGLVGISGWFFELEQLLSAASPVARQQRLLATHGPFDVVIPIAGVRDQVKQLQTAGFNLAWHEFPKAHVIHGEAEMRVIRDFVRAGYPGR